MELFPTEVSFCQSHLWLWHVNCCRGETFYNFLLSAIIKKFDVSQIWVAYAFMPYLMLGLLPVSSDSLNKGVDRQHNELSRHCASGKLQNCSSPLEEQRWHRVTFKICIGHNVMCQVFKGCTPKSRHLWLIFYQWQVTSKNFLEVTIRGFNPLL